MPASTRHAVGLRSNTVAQDELLARLAAAGEELAAAEAARSTALRKVADALGAGDGVVPIKQMAELAGISRVTAYRLLGRPQPSTERKKA